MLCPQLFAGMDLRKSQRCLRFFVICCSKNMREPWVFFNMVSIFFSYLVGGLEHEFYFPWYIGNSNPNWRTHIFQRGRYTTNQICSLCLMCNCSFCERRRSTTSCAKSPRLPSRCCPSRKTAPAGWTGNHQRAGYLKGGGLLWKW